MLQEAWMAIRPRSKPNALLTYYPTANVYRNFMLVGMTSF